MGAHEAHHDTGRSVVGCGECRLQVRDVRADRRADVRADGRAYGGTDGGAHGCADSNSVLRSDWPAFSRADALAGASAHLLSDEDDMSHPRPEIKDCGDEDETSESAAVAP